MATQSIEKPEQEQSDTLTRESRWVRWWRKYSPYHEIPLSSASSFGLHLFLVLLLILFAMSIRSKDPVASAVDVIRVAESGDEAAPAMGDGTEGGEGGSGPLESMDPATETTADAAEAPDDVPVEEVQTEVAPQEV